MSYITQALLTARVGGEPKFIELTDDDADGNPDSTVLKLLMSEVDAIVDGYARRGGYHVPLAVTDYTPILTFLLDIANFKAKTRGDRMASDDDRKLYDDAMRIMEAIASGEFELPSSDTATTRTEFALDSPEGGPFFSRDTLGSF